VYALQKALALENQAKESAEIIVSSLKMRPVPHLDIRAAEKATGNCGQNSEIYHADFPSERCP
jgi:hypothetical protein